ncbi:MAG: O-antigen ligase family protein [Anaerolineae bacterium]
MRSFSKSIVFLFCLALGIASVGAAGVIAGNFLTASRGVEAPLAGAPPVMGTNTALEQYASDADLARALALVKDAHLTAIRQHFPWREIEATRGTYDWAKWDRIVNAAQAANLQIIAVLDTAPAWAQRDYERTLPNAPPDDFNTYAAFAREFARRYGSQIHYYQIWDEPNVHPSWGNRNAEPAEYGQLLHLAAAAIRAQDPAAKILLAGLGMNLETQRPHPDYSEILFLRGLYEAGFQNDFDIVAAKPYGMWSGPEDRTVSSGALNFPRVILLRDEMRAHGDTGKPVWAVEMGWNALPLPWAGEPSPWGSDTEAVQASRLARGLQRARSEWGWMPGLFPMILQPAAPAADPHWGFSLVTAAMQPRSAYQTLTTFATNPPAPLSLPTLPSVSLALLGAVFVLSALGVVRAAPRQGLLATWNVIAAHFHGLPEAVQLGVLVFLVAAFYLAPGTPLSLVLLVLLIPFFALRLDIGLALIVFTIPFFLYPKTLPGGEYSAVEILTLVSVAAAGWRILLLGMAGAVTWRKIRPTSLDWAVLIFVLLGTLSVRFANNFGVAMREFRVIVIEPALLYALLRVTPLSRTQIARLVYALLLAGAVVCVIGLSQLTAGDLIQADALGRVRAVWGSPNNAALFLGRLLPLALALALFVPGLRRWSYAALAALLAVILYFTYSRGALFFGIPASLALIGLIGLWERRGRLRVPRWAVLALPVLGVVAIAALLSTARVQSWFQEGTGTGFFRVAVWTSAVHMIADHPLFGVGLDNFLYEYPKYILPEAWREPNLSHPHNVLLDFWVRLGVFGAVVLLWLQVEFFRRAMRAARRSSDTWLHALVIGLMASMVDFLAHGLIDAAYFVVDLAFVFMLTLALIAWLDDASRQTAGTEPQTDRAPATGG